jgi:hypothetical protein
MATIVITDVVARFSGPDEEHAYTSDWRGYDKETLEPASGKVSYDPDDGFKDAWYSDPTNAGNEIDNLPDV